MKRRGSGLGAVLLCLALCPLAALAIPALAGQERQDGGSSAAVPVGAVGTVSSMRSISQVLEAIYVPDTASGADGSGGCEADYQVLLCDSGETVTLSPADYLRGAVAAEMPLTYADEALKAQIVAAHTYAVSYRIRQLSNPDAFLKGADISDDPSAGQSYLDDAGIRERYGQEAEALMAHLDDLIAEVGDYILIYEGEPIVAAYHAISCGKTDSAQNVWGAYSPYLVGVKSEQDEQSPDFLSRITLSKAEVQRILTEAGAKPSGEPGTWFSQVLVSSSGYVSAANIGGVTFTGSELRALFGLRSACLQVVYGNGYFNFTVKGWGHGVGMSQYGAEKLAEDGQSFDKILLTYYTNARLCEL